MKWIKTSERLPDKEGRYFIIMRKCKDIKTFFNNEIDNNYWKRNVEEWLDESEDETSTKNRILNELKNYFSNTPQDKILEDWKKSEELGNICFDSKKDKENIFESSSN
jgi:hypothetical protein